MSTFADFAAIFAGDALEALLATSAASLLVLALRRPVRQVFGARAAYALWWLLPAALLGVLLPAQQIMPVAIELGRSGAVLASPMLLSADDTPALPYGAQLMPALVAIWLIGCMATLANLAVQQYRFRRSLGRLEPVREGLWKAQAREGLPAVIGLRTRIVLPADFDHRYAPEQQALVLAHERVHAARGDVYWNLGFALLCALQWFNPLLRIAQRAYRLDQELACDARVLALYPHRRRCYGEALLSSSSAFPAAPLGCPAFGTHPLKERITMLTRPLPSLSKVSAGFALCLALGTGFAGLAWAQQAPRVVDAEMLDIQLQLSIEGGPAHSPRVITPAGQEFGIRLEAPDGQEWAFDLTAQRPQDGQIDVSGRITRDGQLAGSPQIKLHEGVPGRIAHESPDGSGNFSLSMTINATDDVVPPVPPAPPSPPAPPAPPSAVSAPAAPAIPAAPAAPAPLPQPAPVITADPPQGENTEVAYRKLHPLRYPKDAVQQRLQGETLVDVQVLSSGVPGQMSVRRSSGSELLDRAALEALAQSQFHPAKRAGRPVESRIQVPIRFSLDEAQAEAVATAATDATTYTPPSYRRLSPPEYPASAKSFGQQGTAVLKVGIDASGNVQTVDIADSSGVAELDRAASTAVEHWTFNPASTDGTAVGSQVLVPVQFIAANGNAAPFTAPPGALDTITLRAD